MFKCTREFPKLTKETINDEIITEIMRNYTPEVIVELDEFLAKLGFGTSRELFKQATQTSLLARNLMTAYGSIQYMQTATIQFHMRLLIRQIFTTTRQSLMFKPTIEFIRKCPGINDTIDYKYYIEDIYNPWFERWVNTMKALFKHYPELFVRNYTTCDMFQFSTPRYIVNEVAQTDVDLTMIDLTPIVPSGLREIAEGFINMVSIARAAMPAT